MQQTLLSVGIRRNSSTNNKNQFGFERINTISPENFSNSEIRANKVCIRWNTILLLVLRTGKRLFSGNLSFFIHLIRAEQKEYEESVRGERTMFRFWFEIMSNIVWFYWQTSIFWKCIYILENMRWRVNNLWLSILYDISVSFNYIFIFRTVRVFKQEHICNASVLKNQLNSIDRDDDECSPNSVHGKSTELKK